MERMDGAKRFHSAARARRDYHYVPRSGRAASSTSSVPGNQAALEAESRKPKSAAGRRTAVSGNLNRFLEAIKPSVSAQCISKKKMRGWRTCDDECGTYFTLGDLWESFKEWSAYGAGVPLVLSGRDSVFQYYVPYLSGIQLYADSTSQLFSPRRPGEDCDINSSRDSSSDGSSDSEIERGCKCSDIFCKNHHSNYSMFGMDKLSMEEKHISSHDDFSSDDSDCGDPNGCLIFEYLEHDGPYCREPLADKVSDLAKQFPALQTIKSCDLLPSSWFCVAWYPIYLIPTGPTLRNLDACFLTFHSLSTSMKGADSAFGPTITKPCGVGVPKISLPVFGLASYKFKSSIWTSSNGYEGKLAYNLLQAADSWLRLLNVNLPDYSFFASQNRFYR